MNDRMNDDHTDRGPRQGDDRDRSPGRNDSDRDHRGDGQDTRFLQLEMSRVLYAEAEGVTKQALRELLLDAAKARLRERFGEAIASLAQLATDELLADIEASLEVEGQIQRRHASSDGTDDRLREALGRKRSAGSPGSGERKQARASGSRRRRR